MVDSDLTNDQLMDQEQITTVLQTADGTSSTGEITQIESSSITGPLIELVSTNSDAESNSTAVNTTTLDTVENDHPCISNDFTNQPHPNDEDNCADKSINGNESFDGQNLGDQVSNVEQDISTDQYDSEYDENSEDEVVENENLRVEDFFWETAPDQMFQTIAPTPVFVSEVEGNQKIESEPITTYSGTMDQAQQLNESTIIVPPEPTPQREEAISSLSNKLTSVLRNDHYTSEIAYVQKKLIFNIVLVGPARVGKSSLVNALTGNTKKIAKTTASLQSCTQTLDQYEVYCESLDDIPADRKCKVFIWDTKGVEDWAQQSGVNTMFQFIDEIKPICVVFCAAPGAFANLGQVQAVLNYCQWKKILCATVLTNMWSGSSEARETVMKELRQLVTNYGPQRDWTFANDNPNPHLSKHTVHVFGDRALCTMVNSQPFVHPFFPDKAMPVQGIDELTHCIMQLLSEEQLRGWCQAVLGNRSFFERIHQRANGFVLDRYAFLRDLAAVVINDMENQAKTFGGRFLDFFEKLIQ